MYLRVISRTERCMSVSLYLRPPNDLNVPCVAGAVVPRLCHRRRNPGTPGNRGKLTFIGLEIHTSSLTPKVNELFSTPSRTQIRS